MSSNGRTTTAREATGIAEQLCRARDAARVLLGDRYDADIKLVVDEFAARHAADGSGESRLSFAIGLMRHAQRTAPAGTMLVYMAATVEWVEGEGASR